MGWTFPNRATREDVIREIVPKEHVSANGHVFRTLKYECVGRREVYALHESGQPEIERKWIGVYLLEEEPDTGFWGYKNMSEDVGPLYYSCPLSYIDEADPPVNETAREWREKVREKAGEPREPIIKVREV